MVFLDYLYVLLIQPIQLLFEAIFSYAYDFSGSCVLSIIVLSLIVNFLVLPLYNRADQLQLIAREKENAIRPMADHIKKVFTGDEKIMMLQTYYHETGYSPLNILKSSVSLLLQIPFFMAAYYFLSNLEILKGVSMGPISDLGLPDALIHIGTININLLPVIMTVINIVSSFIYSGKSSAKEKAKLIILALVFLVLLYGSPSGLVFYWILNNLFSLIKNTILLFRKEKVIKEANSENNTSRKDMAILFLSCTVLAILTGLMIPVDVIDKNPAELVNTFIPNPHSPLNYLINSFLIAIGTFLIWIPVFVYLVKGKHGKQISYAFLAYALVGIVNFLAFNRNFGLLTSRLVYEKPMEFQIKDILINLLVDAVIVALVFVIGYKRKDYIKKIVAVLLASSLVISGTSLGFYAYAYHGANFSINSYDEINIPMTRTGKNVVIIMMDRMISSYIPYIFAEHPEIEKQFAGFTYYPNTVSFGAHTNFAVPALFGGYDYTPEKLNERSDELLVDKHNEALHVLPTLFANNGWRVTVGDPPYANYSWLVDTSIYDDDEGVNAFNMSLAMNNEQLSEFGIDSEARLKRDFYCYGLMKTLPFVLQPLVYSKGSYNQIDSSSDQGNLLGTFERERLALSSLSDFTEITDSSQNCFFMFSNETTHEVCLLSDKKYDQPPVVNNVPMYLDNEESYKHYQCNIEACILLGKWFDYLRENNIYDNTRIILVADHGYGLNNFDDLLVMDLDFDVEWVNPILMVKDYDQKDFSVSSDFMTNADTPYLAVNGLISNPVNPFTNRPIVRNDKNESQLIYVSHEFNTVVNNGKQFKDKNAFWLSVHNNIRDDKNWKRCDK